MAPMEIIPASILPMLIPKNIPTLPQYLDAIHARGILKRKTRAALMSDDRTGYPMAFRDAPITLAIPSNM